MWRIVDEWPETVLRRIDSSLQLVTLKASLIVPADAVLLGGLLTRTGPPPSPGQAADSAVVLNCIGATLIFASLCLAVYAISAFLRGDHGSGNAYNSLLFFGSIAGMRLEDFISKSHSADEEIISNDLLRQVHLLSSVLVKKFRLVNVSLVLLVIGTLVGFSGSWIRIFK